MNRKLYIIFIVLAILIAGVVFYVVVANKLIPGKNASPKPLTDKDTTKIIQEQKNVGVVYGENGFIPGAVNVKKGGIVGVFNSTKEEIAIIMTGKMGTKMQIKASSTMFTPVLTEKGEYKLTNFKDSSKFLDITVSE